MIHYGHWVWSCSVRKIHSWVVEAGKNVQSQAVRKIKLLFKLGFLKIDVLLSEIPNEYKTLKVVKDENDLMCIIQY